MSDEARDREGTPGLGASKDAPLLLLSPSKPADLPSVSVDADPERVEASENGDVDEPGEAEPVRPRELGRVADPAAHDAATGARGLLKVEVPAAWLEEGGTLVLDAPERLVCARCEGGGCEGCNNSGGLRARTEQREVRITLPAGVASATRVRLEAPFGDDSPVRQLWVDLVPTAGQQAPSVRFHPARTDLVIATGEERPLGPPRPRPLVVALVVLAIFLALVIVARGR